MSVWYSCTFMANQLLLAYTLTPLWPFFTVATDFITAIFWIPILWLQLFQINSPLLLGRVNNVTSKKLQCICKNARMLLYLTVYFSSKFDCLYVVSFSGLLGFCFVCFYWLESKGIFLHTISPYLMTQAKYKHGKAAVPVSEYTRDKLIYLC